MVEKRLRLPAPSGLSASHLTIDGEELLVLEFPLPVLGNASVLTPAEQEVALAAANGQSTAEIAKARNRSPRTIAHQLDSIYEKLGVSSRLELTMSLTKGSPPGR
ncbi:MAG TPA: helix-turn-helix transcriptional regulator [Polyangiaceae bacterium]|jgi:DNA-binding NarL/FixJ family response regulator|nr:helix-turn-helix transcriptional regulator [Polyangiaceae bacterium]